MRTSPFRMLLVLPLLQLVQACDSGADRVLSPPTTALLRCEPMNRVTGASSPSADIVLQTTNPFSAHSTSITGATSPRFDYGDTDGCPISESDSQPIDLTYVGDAHNYPNGSYPVEFEGQAFVFDDVAGSWNSYSTCPDVLTNVRFAVVINGNVEVFQSVGQAHWIGEVPILSDNFARGRYQLPYDIMYSQSGRYSVTGGTVKVACVHADWQFFIGSSFNEIDVSAYKIYGYEGSWRVATTATWNPTSGWTFYDSATGYANGSSNGWSQALSNYVNNHTCSPYWDIIVDGVKVCENGVAMT
jgi:hypothetical protein